MAHIPPRIEARRASWSFRIWSEPMAAGGTFRREELPVPLLRDDWRLLGGSAGSPQSEHWQPGAGCCGEWMKDGRFDPLAIGRRTS